MGREPVPGGNKIRRREARRPAPSPGESNLHNQLDQALSRQIRACTSRPAQSRHTQNGGRAGMTDLPAVPVFFNGQTFQLTDLARGRLNTQTIYAAAAQATQTPQRSTALYLTQTEAFVPSLLPHFLFECEVSCRKWESPYS